MNSSNPPTSTKTKGSIHVKLMILGSGQAGLSTVLYAVRTLLA